MVFPSGVIMQRWHVSKTRKDINTEIIFFTPSYKAIIWASIYFLLNYVRNSLNRLLVSLRIFFLSRDICSLVLVKQKLSHRIFFLTWRSYSLYSQPNQVVYLCSEHSVVFPNFFPSLRPVSPHFHYLQFKQKDVNTGREDWYTRISQ